VLYLAMELVKGEDLGTLIQAGTLAPRDVLEVMAQVCDGLAVAHQHHVLHRDIKPSNIRVMWDGRRLQAKILDFGVAKMLDTDTTDEGTVLGTVNYMAPEYLQSGHADARSDLFAVGVILYEALSGIPPFDGPTPGSVVYRLLHETPAPLPPTALHGISRDIQPLVQRALAKDPAGRFQLAEELAAALRAAREPGWRWDREPAATAAPAEPPPPASAVRREARPSSGPLPRLRPSEPSASSDVQRDVLETTLVQLRRTVDLDPTNLRAQALLLVTLYRLGRPEALGQVLWTLRSQGVAGPELLEVPRFRQVAEEERRAPRLAPDLHAELMAFLEGSGRD
ncbi:MAG TPA: serine/threonine-protein kinase, partial [Holophagaceae bacterium]